MRRVVRQTVARRLRKPRRAEQADVFVGLIEGILAMSRFRRLSLLLPLSLFGVVAPSVADQGWQFRLSPYMWFAGLEGDVATIPGSPPASIDISPSDALNDTEVGVMVMLDARRGRHGVFADFIYTDVQSDEALIPAPINLNLRSKTKTTVLVRDLQPGWLSDGRAGWYPVLGPRFGTPL